MLFGQNIWWNIEYICNMPQYENLHTDTVPIIIGFDSELDVI